MTALAAKSMTNYHGHGGWLLQALATLRLWNERRRQRAQLAELTDLELHDIGLSRSLTAAETAKPFWEP
jgi:uncharacterized protein YjiS (DUF1127 family)